MFPRRCLKHAEWKKRSWSEGEVLVCSRCGETLAFYYVWNGRVRAYLFRGYDELRDQLSEQIYARAAFRGLPSKPIDFCRI